MLQTGIFAGPIAGLKYQTPTVSGLTNEKGEFQYRRGERVAFLVGNTSIGSAIGAPRINLAEIVSRVDGNISKLLDPGLTNIARFLCSLDRDGSLDGGVSIDPKVHDIIGQRRINFRHDISFAGLARDLQAAHYALPSTTSYNAERIPYAYSPLGFYLAGLANDVLRLSLADAFRFLPLLAAAFAVVAFALLARTVLDGRWAAVAAVFCALLCGTFLALMALIVWGYP